MNYNIIYLNIFVVICSIIYAYICYHLKCDFNESFLEYKKCPACYGQTLCKNITDSENEYILNNVKWNLVKLLDVRNVHFGSINGQPAVFKKLGQNWELEEFDTKICEAQKPLGINSEVDSVCNPGRALQLILEYYQRNISLFIQEEEEIFEDSDAVKCFNSPRLLDLLLERFKKYGQTDDHVLANFVTILAINPEPLILMAFPEIGLPKVLGSCGRCVAIQYAGVPLTNVLERSWSRRAWYAVQLLQMARRFSDAEVRLYMTDPRADNFAVDDHDLVRLVDAEGIVLLHSRDDGLEEEEHVSDGGDCSDCFSFSYEDLCSHRTTDHNFFAVCKGILSSTPFDSSLPEGLLFNTPQWVLERAPNLHRLIELCASPTAGTNEHANGNDNDNSLNSPEYQVNRNIDLETRDSDNNEALEVHFQNNANNENLIVNSQDFEENVGVLDHQNVDGDNEHEFHNSKNKNEGIPYSSKGDEIHDKETSFHRLETMKSIKTRRQAAELLEKILTDIL